MSLRNNPIRRAPGSSEPAVFARSGPMLHTPIPDRIASTDDDRRLPPTLGILLAMAMSLAMWGAIYAACVVRF